MFSLLEKLINYYFIKDVIILLKLYLNHSLIYYIIYLILS